MTDVRIATTRPAEASHVDGRWGVPDRWPAVGLRQQALARAGSARPASGPGSLASANRVACALGRGQVAAPYSLISSGPSGTSIGTRPSSTTTG